MNHPDDLLAEYVDGTLSEQDRVAVRAHVDGCARCREEVRMATAARRALASIPEVPVPERVVERAMGAALARRSGAPRWYRWGGAAAAAAAIVALVAVTLPSLGGRENEGITAAAPADSGAEALGPSTSRDAIQLEVTTAPVELRNVVQWITHYQSKASVDSGGMAENSPVPVDTAFGLANLETTPKPEGTEKALACVQQAFPDAVQDPVRLIEATYRRHRAYLAITFDDSIGDGRPDVAKVWIAATSDCSAISSTQALLPATDASPSPSP